MRRWAARWGPRRQEPRARAAGQLPRGLRLCGTAKHTRFENEGLENEGFENQWPAARGSGTTCVRHRFRQLKCAWFP